MQQADRCCFNGSCPIVAPASLPFRSRRRPPTACGPTTLGSPWHRQLLPAREAVSFGSLEHCVSPIALRCFMPTSGAPLLPSTCSAPRWMLVCFTHRMVSIQPMSGPLGGSRCTRGSPASAVRSLSSLCLRMPTVALAAAPLTTVSEIVERRMRTRPGLLCTHFSFVKGCGCLRHLPSVWTSSCQIILLRRLRGCTAGSITLPLIVLGKCKVSGSG